MKTVKRVVTLDVPASPAVLIAGLDPHALHPALSAAEQELAAAEQRRDAHEQECKQLALRERELAVEAARGQKVAEYRDTMARLTDAFSLGAVYDEGVARAREAVATAKAEAEAACRSEALRRQDVLNQAGIVLAAALKDLDALQQALTQAAMALPNNIHGGGVFFVGNYRDKLQGAGA